MNEEIEAKAIKQLVEKFESEMQCNCDLNNWEPTKQTGHSHVCRIHKAAIAKAQSKQ